MTRGLLLAGLCFLTGCCSRQKLARPFLTPEKVISDLPDGITFSHKRIVSWSPPENWSSSDEIMKEGHVIFTPKKGTLPHVYFGATSIIIGRLKNTAETSRDFLLELYRDKFKLKAQGLESYGRETITTLYGHKAQVFFIKTKDHQVGAVAYIKQKNDLDYFLIHGEKVRPPHCPQTALGTLYRMLYRYEYWPPEIMQ